MYEFDKEGYLTACDYRSLDMLYNTSSAGRSESRDKLLHYIKNLADAYEAAINLLNTYESAKCRRCESESTKDEKDRAIAESISKEDEILEELFKFIWDNEDEFHVFDPEEFKCGEC